MPTANSFVITTTDEVLTALSVSVVDPIAFAQQVWVNQVATIYQQVSTQAINATLTADGIVSGTPDTIIANALSRGLIFTAAQKLSNTANALANAVG
jgi:hypothetical protein